MDPQIQAAAVVVPLDMGPLATLTAMPLVATAALVLLF